MGAELPEQFQRPGPGVAGLFHLAGLELGGGQQQGVDGPAPHPAGRKPGERLGGAAGGRSGLFQVAVAVGEFVGEVGGVEVGDPVRIVVRGGVLQGLDGLAGHARAGPRVAQQGVAARLGRVAHRLRGGRQMAAGTLLGGPGQLRDLPRVAQRGRQVAHPGGQHIPAVGPVPGRLRQPQRLDVVPLRQPRLPGVDRHVPGQLRQPRHRPEQPAPRHLAVRAGQQPGDHAVEVVHHDRPHMPAAEPVVEVHQRLGGRAHRRHVRRTDSRPSAPRDGRVRGRDQPVPAGTDQRRGGQRGAGEEVPAAGVAAPQLTGPLDGAGHGQREVQAHPRGGVLGARHADVLDGDGAAELAAQHLGHDGRNPAARLLAAQPPAD